MRDKGWESDKINGWETDRRNGWETDERQIHIVKVSELRDG